LIEEEEDELKRCYTVLTHTAMLYMHRHLKFQCLYQIYNTSKNCGCMLCYANMIRMMMMNTTLMARAKMH